LTRVDETTSQPLYRAKNALQLSGCVRLSKPNSSRDLCVVSQWFTWRKPPPGRAPAGSKKQAILFPGFLRVWIQHHVASLVIHKAVGNGQRKNTFWILLP